MGVYIAEFVIVWNDGKIDKVPSGDPTEGPNREDFLTIEIVEDVEGIAPIVTGGVGG